MHVETLSSHQIVMISWKGTLSSLMGTISDAEIQKKSESASDIKAEPAIAKSLANQTKVEKPVVDDLAGPVAALALVDVTVPNTVAAAIKKQPQDFYTRACQRNNDLLFGLKKHHPARSNQLRCSSGRSMYSQRS